MNQATDIISIQNMINSYQLKLDQLMYDLKEQRSMLESVLENDDEYQKELEETQKLTKTKNIAKQKVFKRPESQMVIDKIKEITSELREVKVALSDYLSQYVIISGSRSFEDQNGTLLQIITSAKLIKKKS